MIYLDNANIRIKVWKIDRKEKYTELRASTSEKNKDGTYTNSNWFPRAIGPAHEALKNVNEGDTIYVKKAKFSNEPYTTPDGQKKSAFRFLIMELGEAQQPHQSAPSAPAKQKINPVTADTNVSVDGEGEIPW